jgi:O-antigen ligase
MLFKKLSYSSLLFSMMLLSGALKPFIITYIGNIDIVLFVSVLSFLFILKNKGRLDKTNLDSSIVLLLFTTYIILSWTYTTSPSYVFNKTFSYCLNLLFFIFPFFLKQINVRQWIWLYGIILIPLTYFFIQMKAVLWTSLAPDDSFMDLKSNYLALGYHLGVLLILLNYYKQNVAVQILVLVLLFASSARGPLLFALITLIVLNIQDIRTLLYNMIKRFGYVIVVLSITSIFFIAFQNKIMPLLENALQRYDRITTDDKSLAARYELFEFALYKPFDSIKTLFFGFGFGSFGIEFFKEDMRAYPHNILLEIFFELGLVGLCLFIVFLVLVFKVVMKSKNIFSFILLFSLLNAAKSYNLADAWVLFMFFGCSFRQFYEQDNLTLK